MSANSGSDGAASGFDSIGRDTLPADGDPALRPWDSDLPARQTTTEGSGSAPAPEPGERD